MGDIKQNKVCQVGKRHGKCSGEVVFRDVYGLKIRQIGDVRQQWPRQFVLRKNPTHIKHNHTWSLSVYILEVKVKNLQRGKGRTTFNLRRNISGEEVVFQNELLQRNSSSEI